MMCLFPRTMKNNWKKPQQLTTFAFQGFRNQKQMNQNKCLKVWDWVHRRIVRV